MTPKQEEMKTVFEEPAQHDSGHDQWTNTDMLGNVYDDAEHHFSESNALATDLDGSSTFSFFKLTFCAVLNEVSLSTLLLQNETFNFGTLSQPPSVRSLSTLVSFVGLIFVSMTRECHFFSKP